MDHGESIYNIIPPKPIVEEKPPMHKSKHSPVQPPTASTFHTKSTTQPFVSNIAGDGASKPVADKAHAGFGRAPGSYKNNPGTFTKKGAISGGKVATLSEMKRSNPEALRPSEVKPRSKAGAFIPGRDEPPVMNLVTSKNFIVANAVETILSVPKVQQGSKDYLKKEDYGKVPKYLAHIKQDIQDEYDYISQLQAAQEEAQQARVRGLDDKERLDLIEGLKLKWEQVNTAYQGTTHLTTLDTMGKIKRKEKYEAELSQIEKDIEKLSKKQILVDQAF